MIKMHRLVLLFIFIPIILSPQEGFYSIPKRIAFADNLLCNKEYDFAAYEYSQIADLQTNDTIQFKLGFAYFKTGRYNNARTHFGKINDNLFQEYKEYLDVLEFNSASEEREFIPNTVVGKKLLKLKSFYKNDFHENYDSELFSELESTEIKKWFNVGNQFKEKSLILSGVYSALIPGLGKIYSGQTGDGITAFVVTSLLTYLSYDNFKHNHDFRGYLFGSLSGIFYAGNIYGSVVSAHQFNLRVRLEKENLFFSFLESTNYFLSEPTVIKCK